MTNIVRKNNLDIVAAPVHSMSISHEYVVLGIMMAAQSVTKRTGINIHANLFRKLTLRMIRSLKPSTSVTNKNILENVLFAQTRTARIRIYSTRMQRIYTGPHHPFILQMVQQQIVLDHCRRSRCNQYIFLMWVQSAFLGRGDEIAIK